MKNVFFSIVLLFASVSAFAGGTTSSGGTVYTSISNESFGYADLRGGDGGCIETETIMYATRSANRINFEKWIITTEVKIDSMVRRNTCTGVLEFSASGIGPVESFQHIASTSKDGVVTDAMASVVATVLVNDTVSGSRVPVRVSLIWTAFGVKTLLNHETKHIYPGGYWDLSALLRGSMYIESSVAGSLSDGVYEYAQTYASATWAQTNNLYMENSP